jgi:hypothetical protein
MSNSSSYEKCAWRAVYRRSLASGARLSEGDLLLAGEFEHASLKRGPEKESNRHPRTPFGQARYQQLGSPLVDESTDQGGKRLMLVGPKLSYLHDGAGGHGLKAQGPAIPRWPITRLDWVKNRTHPAMHRIKDSF